ncbi:MAG: metallophosphoesterase [Clostridia bacterium]|nr:metallophosphoesterase [Clostridia bacterium]
MEHAFLKCYPSVFVVGREYEILVTAKTNGIICVRADGEAYYEENSGVLSSEKSYAKIRLPQEALDAAKAYEIVFRETVERKAYFSEFKEEQTARFAFKPLIKTEDIRIYQVADVHYHFERALLTARYFGEDTDLFVVNGDIGEVETEENYFEVCQFVGELAKGKIPVILARGNHDARGKLAERYTDYFPCNGKATYYDFRIGCLQGVVLDCGEDKVDESAALGGADLFAPYRRKQTAFLRGLDFGNGDFSFAVCHISPVTTSYWKERDYIIEKDVYADWNAELERLGIAFLLCGHLHKAIYMPPNGEYSLLPHKYPVITGSAWEGEDFIGTAVTVYNDRVEIAFTNGALQTVEKHILRR